MDNPLRSFKEMCEFSSYRLKSAYYKFDGKIMRFNRDEINQQIYAEFRGWASKVNIS